MNSLKVDREPKNEFIKHLDYLSRRVFREIMQIERSLEVEKEGLAMREDFILSACHAMFAKSPVHKLTPVELANACQS